MPAMMSALSSSLHERSQFLRQAMSHDREQKDAQAAGSSSPASTMRLNGLKDRRDARWAEQGETEQPGASAAYAAETAAPILSGQSSSSASRSSNSSSPLQTPNSSSPSPSASPRLSPTSTLPRPSLPRRIPQPSDGFLHASPSILSSSAPVASVHLAIHEDDEEEAASISPPAASQRRMSAGQQSSPHQLLSKSKMPDPSLGRQSPLQSGISSLSSLLKPSQSQNSLHDGYRRSRRLSQDSPPLAKPAPPPPLDPEHVVFLTNAGETGYPGYAQLASHESLDYHTVHNELLRAELSGLTDADYIWDNVQRWCVTILLGAAIGIVGFISHYAIERISAVKFDIVAYYLSRDWRLAYAIYAWSNVLLVLVGSVLIVYFCPAAAGSGLPEVKAYLNGAAVSGQC